MKIVNLPGFTAAACLYQAVWHYQCTAIPVNSASEKRIVPQAPVSCGECSPLKWPDGTNTGTCVQDCCATILFSTSCQFVACACPPPTGGTVGGGGIFTGGGGIFTGGGVLSQV
jgi:hypothetical protein